MGGGVGRRPPPSPRPVATATACPHSPAQRLVDGPGVVGGGQHHDARRLAAAAALAVHAVDLRGRRGGARSGPAAHAPPTYRRPAQLHLPPASAAQSSCAATPRARPGSPARCGAGAGRGAARSRGRQAAVCWAARLAVGADRARRRAPGRSPACRWPHCASAGRHATSCSPTHPPTPSPAQRVDLIDEDNTGLRRARNLKQEAHQLLALAPAAAQPGRGRP